MNPVVSQFVKKLVKCVGHVIRMMGNERMHRKKDLIENTRIKETADVINEAPSLAAIRHPFIKSVTDRLMY